ncbi:MAG TPA: EboA domain-containing protein, partial [Acidobacteriota bacterium]|nr:EboA domain-containing protein [Acidobacteriota bacterium]
LEAIACRNPYPARYFPELNFNQMVLKCLFVGVEIHRIVGLGERFNPELSRMCNDYVDEREAAGRSVPVEVWLALLPKCEEDRLPRALSYLRHEEAAHRYWVVAGLAYRGDESRAELVRHRKAESDPRVLSLIDRVLDGEINHENL